MMMSSSMLSAFEGRYHSANAHENYDTKYVDKIADGLSQASEAHRGDEVIERDTQSNIDPRTIPPLGMTRKDFLNAASSSIHQIEQYYFNVVHREVIPSVQPGYLPKLLPDSAPEKGESWDDIQADIGRKIIPGITHWQSPKFMAYFSASSTYPGILGELWSAAFTAPGFDWICSPAMTELETVVLDWLAKILGLPEEFLSQGKGGGVIQGSASESILACMIGARERFIRRQIEREGLTNASDEVVTDRSCELRSKLVAIGSDQTHSSTQKGSIVAGTRFVTIRTRHREGYAMQGRDLRRKIEELHARGLHPYFLTVSIGATAVCAVDDFESIREVARDYPDIWIHCDAAYAGAALVLPEYHYLSKQMTLVNSFNFNKHKWLLTNMDASCLWVQNRRDLTDALSIDPAYLRNKYTDSGLVTDYRDWQIPMGRRFRALKVWFVLRTWGVQGLKDHIQHHINLGELFADLVRGRSDLFSILVTPIFALTVITVNPHTWRNLQGLSPYLTARNTTTMDSDDVDDPILSTANDATKEVYEIITAKREWFLTSTVVNGVYAIRVVSANPQAEEKYVRAFFRELVSTTEEVLARHGRIASSSSSDSEN